MAKTSFAFPKPQYWQEFEDLTHEVFKIAFNDPTPAKHGRSGQNQYGIDVFGRRGGRGDIVAIQCKRKEDPDENGKYRFGHSLTKKDIEDEVEKVDPLKLMPTQLIVATTAPTDGVIQRWVEEYNEKRWQKEPDTFRVSVWHWQDYESYINGNETLRNWYLKEYMALLGQEISDRQILFLLRDAFSRPAFRDPLYRENARNFQEAIQHTQIALDTGELKDRVSGITIRKANGGVRAFSNPELKKLGQRLHKKIMTLSGLLAAGLVPAPGEDIPALVQDGPELLIFDNNLRTNMDRIRVGALEDVNQMLLLEQEETIEVPTFQ